VYIILFVGVFMRTAAAENATGICRNWYRLTYYINMCVYNRYLPIYNTYSNQAFSLRDTDRNVAFPARLRAHTHVKYYIRYIIYIHIYMHLCILYELCYPILHRRLQQLALSPGCGRGALFFTVSSSCLTLN